MALTARTAHLCAPTAAAATATFSRDVACAAPASTGPSECTGTQRGLGDTYPTQDFSLTQVLLCWSLGPLPQLGSDGRLFRAISCPGVELTLGAGSGDLSTCGHGLLRTRG